MNLTSDIAEV